MQSRDGELIEKIKLKDEDAFTQLFKRYKVMVFSYIYQMIKNVHTAEDIFVEAFMRLVKILPKANSEFKIKPFLYKTSHNLVIDYFRKQSKAKLVSLEQTPQDSYDQTASAKTYQDILGTNKNLPSDQMQTKQLEKALEDAISILPQKQKDVFLLRHYSGMSFKEVARVLNCPLNTALSHMQYALKTLRKQLKPFYEGE